MLSDVVENGMFLCPVYPQRKASGVGMVSFQSVVIGKNTMARHRKNNRLTQEERKEIALLANAGISRPLLAKDYKISIHTILEISKQRRTWIEEKQIATKKMQKFRYAQKLYPQLNNRLRKYVLNLVFEPIIGRIQERLVGDSPERLFLKAVLGPRSLPKIDKKAVAESRARIRKTVLVLIHDDTKKQAMYDDVKQAVVGMTRLVTELEEATLGSRERKAIDRLRKKIDQVLKTLKPQKRTIVKLRYGIEDGRIHLLKEIGPIFHLTAERVRQIEIEAIEQLKDTSTADELRKLVDSPALRRFIRPSCSRRRAKM